MIKPGKNRRTAAAAVKTAVQQAQGAAERALVQFYAYQAPVFACALGMLVLHWSRQIGKSFTLAAWAVDRLLTNPGRLVTVLSNSKQNGMEFVLKCREVCQLLGIAMQEQDLSPDQRIENMAIAVRIKVAGKWGRILVLAANPRTARGFSGDLILDEFAFHENSFGIWDAASPILEANPGYSCRIASTGNGRHNLFYKFANVAPGAETTPEGFRLGQSGVPVSRVPRSLAYTMGRKIYHGVTRKEISPEEAYRLAIDKRSYRQNFECEFMDEAMALLRLELLTAAEYSVSDGGAMEYRICETDWSADAVAFLRSLRGPLAVGVDVGRKRDLTVITVAERVGGVAMVRAILRISNMPLPKQHERLALVLGLPSFGRACIDANGIGLGLAEWAQTLSGCGHRVESVMVTAKEKREVRGIEQSDSALISELIATDMLTEFEQHTIRIPYEEELRNALLKPEKHVSPSGRVQIAATTDEAGHADEFWSLGLCLRALRTRADALRDASQISVGTLSTTGREIFVPRTLVSPFAGMHQQVT